MNKTVENLSYVLFIIVCIVFVSGITGCSNRPAPWLDDQQEIE